MLAHGLRLLLLAFLLGACPALQAQVRFGSAHALVLDEATGEVLLEKDANTAAPMASITKLMTAMVVLDAGLDPAESVCIDEADMDWLKHTKRGLPVGACLPRDTVLELAQIASDNHAAAALARTYPGGTDGFHAAVQTKIATLGLALTQIEEPTGLSPSNQASAADLAAVIRAASGYPAIERITSSRSHTALINGHRWAVRNTNALVGKPGWDILLSKTGFTNEAGSCVAMRVRAAGRTLIVVLMGAVKGAQRAADAMNVLRFVGGERVMVAEDAPPAQTRARDRKARRATKVAVAHVG
jgi:D-alanyl-D-alanine endopeptidase (penicillin-binding protein 7)